MTRDELETELTKKDQSHWLKNNVGGATWLFAAIGLILIAFIVLISLSFIIDSVSDHYIHKPEKLIKWKSESEKASEASSRSIFLVDIIDENNGLSRKSVESCVKMNQNADIVYLGLRKSAAIPNETFWLDMRIKYPNLHLSFPNLTKYLEGSIFEDVYNPSQKKSVHLLFAKLLTLWQFGGVVMPAHWISRRPYNRFDFVKENKSLILGVYNGEIAFLDSVRPCHNLLFDLMKEVIRLNLNAPNLDTNILDLTTQKFNPKFDSTMEHFKQLGYPYLCNNQTIGDNCIFMHSDNMNDDVKQFKSNSITWIKRFYYFY